MPFDEPAETVIGSAWMTMSAQRDLTPPTLRFGVFELDPEAGQLYRNGRQVRMQPKPFKLLCLLADRAGMLVTREQIQKELWSADTFVDFEQGVNFAIKQVREALAEDADRPLYIQTVPKRGYRFLAPVERVSDEKDADEALFRPRTDGRLNKLLWMHVTELKLDESRRLERRKLALKIAGAAAIALALLVGAFLFLR
jgi:DNA-binding winged helix-turn-helix (wHTH) protein